MGKPFRYTAKRPIEELYDKKEKKDNKNKSSSRILCDLVETTRIFFYLN